MKVGSCTYKIQYIPGVVEAAADVAAADVRRGLPAFAAFLQNSVKLDRRELLTVLAAFLLELEDTDFPVELLELELLNSS